MKNTNYVISVKRTKNYNNEALKEEEQYFEYAGVDRYSGAMSSGYPIFLGEHHATKFETEEQANAWWENNKKALLMTTNMDRYDLSTLAVRKISYRKIKPLSV